MEGQDSLQLGVAVQDLARLAKVSGQVLSVYLPLQPGVENAGQRSEAAWKAARQELEGAGVPNEVLDHVDDLVPDAHQHGHSLAVIADASGVLHSEHGPVAPPATRWSWAPLPSLGPIIEWRQGQPGHVLVLADRAGADLIAYAGQESVDRREAGDEDDVISRVKPGGWSQRRYQERALNSWEGNAEATAAELARMVKQHDARLVVAAGDVRAIEMLEKDLPQEIQGIFVKVEGARNAGADTGAIEEEALRQVEILASQETGQILAKFREEVGQSDLAVQGKDNTLEALSRAQVDTLLVYDDPEDDRPAYFTSEPIPVAATEGRLEELGVEPRTKGRVVDVVIRAALGTGAGVRIIPGESGVADNIGALLRWTT